MGLRGKWMIWFLLVAGSISAQQQIFLVGRTIGYKTLHTGDSVRIFGFSHSLFGNPTSPGPTLYMNEGDSVELEFYNFSQGAPHTIHLHGLDVNQANDGVPHLSFEVYHMESDFYRFRAPHAGTYLYHCHVVSALHVQAGMYGLIIVRPPDGSNTTWDGGYPFDHEHAFFTSELDTNWHTDSVLNHEYDTALVMNMVPIPAYHPQHFLVNGLSEHQIDTNADIRTSIGAANYLRFANIGYYGNRVIFPAAMNVQVVSSDGRPLPNVETSDTLEIYPGERFGILSTSTFEYLDSIAIEYFDLNTGTVRNTQYVEVDVQGTFSVEEPQPAKDMRVYPNPTAEDVFIDFEVDASKHLLVQVTDISGKVVIMDQLTVPAGTSTAQLQTNALEPGTYILQLTANDGTYSRSAIWVKQ